jgi:hypothetical protein
MSPAIECTTLELISFCFDLLVDQGSVEVCIGVNHRIALPHILLVHKCSIGAKTQLATLHRSLPMTCSQPLSLHDRGDHLCRDGGVKSRYFERADRGAGLMRSPIFGACSSARLASLRFELERTNLMPRCASQVWRSFAYIYIGAVAALSLYTHDVARGLSRTKMSCRAPQVSLPTASSAYATRRECATT